MKLYRQMARFVLFGLIAAFMVFGVQTQAEAAWGFGPEPPGVECGTFVPGAPWIFDVEMYFTPQSDDQEKGSVTAIANVTYKNYKYIISGTSPTEFEIPIDEFIESTTKEALSQCVVNRDDAFKNEVGDPMPYDALFAPFAVGGYKFDDTELKVSARIIYGLVLPIIP